MFTERKTPCPFSKTTLEQEKDLFNCLGTTDVYHCLLDERNRSGEICHQPIWVSKGFCPQYNTGAKDINIVPCKLSIGCPDVPFRSNEVYKYPVRFNKTNTNYGKGIPEGNKIIPVSPWIFVAVSITVLLVLAVVCYIVCRIIRRKINKKKENACELEPLRDENEIPLGLKKTIDYLKAGVFSYTEAYKHALSILEIHRCVAIIGPPGSGKTITALQLAYLKCGLSKLYLCQTVDEILVTAENNKGAYIIVDDWIDEYVYYPSKIDTAINLLSIIYTNVVQGGNVYLILTAQEDKWNRFGVSLTNCFLCKQKLLLNIDPKTFTDKEKYEMVRCHVDHLSGTECALTGKTAFIENSYVDNKRINDMANNIIGENEFSFPVIIDLICKNGRMRPSRLINLISKDGFSRIIERDFDDWSEDDDISEKRSFCILIFAALLGGKVSRFDFESDITRPLFDKICQKFECYYNTKNEMIQNKTPEEKIENLLRENDRLRSCLYPICYKKNETEFIFQHQTLFKFVLSHIKKRNESEFLIENAHIEVLMKHCWIEKSILEKLLAINELSLMESPIGSVVFPARYFETLTARIRSEREQGYQIPDWNNHIFMRHMEFKNFW